MGHDRCGRRRGDYREYPSIGTLGRVQRGAPMEESVARPGPSTIWMATRSPYLYELMGPASAS